MATRSPSYQYVTIGANKEIRLPVQPTFFVYNNADEINVTGDGTNYTPILFNTEITDKGSNFAANTFTAPVTGIYILSCQIANQGNPAAITNGLCRIKTTTRTYESNFYLSNSTGVANIFFCSSLCLMNATDTAICEIQIDGGATKTSDLAWLNNTHIQFWGALLC